MAPKVDRTGKAGTSGVSAAKAADFAKQMSPDQVALMLHRMSFHYLTGLTFATLDKSATPPGDMIGCLNWLQQVIPDAQKGAGQGWDTAAKLLDGLALKVNQKLDYYNNNFNRIPELTLDMQTAKSMVDALDATGKSYQQMLALLSDYETNKAQVQTAFQNIAADLKADQQQITDLAAQLKQQASVLVAARQEAMGAAGQLHAQFSSEISSIAAQINISWQGLLGALSTCLMFAGPEFSFASAAGKAFAAGGALQAASSFDTTTVSAGGGTIDKDYLISRVQQIDMDAQSLQAAWKASGDFLTPGATNVMLMTTRAKFENFVDQYFPGDKDLRAAFDDFIAKVQSQNQAVAQYNALVSKLLETQADVLAKQDADAALKGSLSSLNAPGLQQLYRLASHAYAAGLKNALFHIYTAGRAYACLTMKPPMGLDALVGISDFSDLTPSAVLAAYNQLNQAFIQYTQDMTNNQAGESFVTMSVDEKKHAATLEQLRQQRSATIIIDPDLPTFVDGHDQIAGMASIRVVKARVYLEGVEVNKVVTVTLTRGGSCSVIPVIQPPGSKLGSGSICFDTPEVETTNSFFVHGGKHYDSDKFVNADPPRKRSNPRESASVFMPGVTWDGQPEPQPLSGIYAAWTVAVPEAHVASETIDLTHVKKIRIEFFVQYNGSPSAHPTVAGSQEELFMIPGVGGRAVAIADRLIRFSFRRGALTNPQVRRLFHSGTVLQEPRRFARNSGFAAAYQKVWPATAMADGPKAFLKNPEQVVALVNKLSAGENERAAVEYYLKTNLDGHLVITRMPIDHGPLAGNRIARMDFPLLATFGLFPGGFNPLTPATASKFLQDPISVIGDQKLLQQERDHLVQAAARNGFEGNFAKLGAASLVKCMHHKIYQNTDGTTTHALFMVTTGQHVMDGIFCFLYHYDPGNPDRITFVGVQAGQHPFPVRGDAFNSFMSPVLIDTLMRAGVAHMECWETSQNFAFGDRSILWDKSKALWLQHSFLDFGDRMGSSYLARARALAGAQTKAEEITEMDLAGIQSEADIAKVFSAGSLSAVEPGIFIGNEQISILSDPSMLDVETAEGQKVSVVTETVLKTMKTQNNYNALRQEMIQYLTAEFGSKWADMSSTEILQSLMSDPESRLHVLSSIRKHFMDPVLPSIADYITNSLGLDLKIAQELIEDQKQRFDMTIATQMLVDGGALNCALRLEVLDKQVNAIDRSTLDAKISKAGAAILAEQNQINALKQKKPADASERERIEDALRQHEEAQDQAQQEQDRYQEQKQDLDNESSLRTHYQGEEKTAVHDIAPTNRD